LDARFGRGANAIKTTFVVVPVVNAVHGVFIAVVGVIVAVAPQPINKSSKKNKMSKKNKKNRCAFASLRRPVYHLSKSKRESRHIIFNQPI